MRAFIAIELPEEIRREIAYIQEELKQAEADVKWVIPENIHLTLKFLGNVPDDKIEKIKTTLDIIATAHKKFETSLFKIGVFPKLEYPRVVWIGVDKNCALIEEIASKVEDKCESIGFPKEDRPFSAHLTIGRVRSPKNKGVLKEKMLSISVKPHSFIVDKLMLFQSTLTPKGPIYTTLHQFPLR